MATLWAKVQYWLLMLGASIMVLLGVYFAGMRTANKAQEKKALQSRIKTREIVDEIASKVSQVDSTDLPAEFDKLRKRRR